MLLLSLWTVSVETFLSLCHCAAHAFLAHSSVDPLAAQPFVSLKLCLQDSHRHTRTLRSSPLARTSVVAACLAQQVHPRFIVILRPSSRSLTARSSTRSLINMQQLGRSCTSSPMAVQCIKNASTAAAAAGLSPAVAAGAVTGSRHARRFSFSSLSSSPAATLAQITPRAFHTASAAALAVPSFTLSGGGGGSRPRSASDGGSRFLVPSAPFSSSAGLMHAGSAAAAAAAVGAGGGVHGGPFGAAGALPPSAAAGPIILRASTRSRFHSLASLHYNEEDEMDGGGGGVMGSHWRACVLDAEVDGGGDIFLDAIENEAANTAPVRFAIEWRGDTQATGAVVASSSSSFSSSAACSSSSSSSSATSPSLGVAATLVSAHRWIESDVSKLSVARGAVWQNHADENDVPDLPVPLAL